MKSLPTISLTIFALSISLLPLDNFSLISSLASRPLWNGWDPLFAIVLVFIIPPVYLGSFSRMNTWRVHPYLAISLLLIIHTGMTNGSLEFLLHFLIVVWTILYFTSLSKWQRGLLVLVLIGVASIYAQWSVLHFIIQRDIGVQLIGESAIATEVPGVAKFASPFTGKKLVRSYGPFPHPNPLAATLLIALTASLFILPKKAREGRHFLLAIFSTIFLGIIVTFSRASLLGVAALLILAFTFRSYLQLHTWALKRFVLLFFLIALPFIPLYYSRLSDAEDRALPDRLQGLVWSMDIIRVQPLFGVGVGNYKQKLEHKLAENRIMFMPWDIAPVHSAPLLYISELGIPIFLIGMFLAVRYFMNQKGYALALLLPLLPAIFTDHFFYTLTFPLIYLLITIYFILGTKPAQH